MCRFVYGNSLALKITYLKTSGSFSLSRLCKKPHLTFFQYQEIIGGGDIASGTTAKISKGTYHGKNVAVKSFFKVDPKSFRQEMALSM